jgi:hypothetical protein
MNNFEPKKMAALFEADATTEPNPNFSPKPGLEYKWRRILRVITLSEGWHK